MPPLSAHILLAVAFSLTADAVLSSPTASAAASASTSHTKVLILGGGVSGIIAARTLHQQGINSFKIVEARSELGGRLRDYTFGVQGNQHTVELGANWVQGTQEDGSAVNPIWTLVQKHGVRTESNDWYGSVTTYDNTGFVDYLNTFNDASDNFDDFTVLAGARVQQNLVDMSARSGFGLIGAKPRTPHQSACEYYNLDWESGQSPEESSWLAAAWGNNFTYNTDQGGYGFENMMSIDQRGFKTFIQAEAADFLQPSQVMLNATVKTIKYSQNGAHVTLTDGRTLSSDYVLTTFSLGVLQNDDVVFDPPLPSWKQEALASMSMATYTKIFLQFPKKFWFDTQMGLYADPIRGRYPVWQSLDHAGFLPGSGIFFVTVTGDFAVAVEAQSDDEVKDEVMGVVRAMFPNITVPEPIAFFFPRWHQDPLYRGAYSNYPPSVVPQHQQNLRAPVGQTLWFAGEYIDLKHFGFLQGAYFSGVDIATELVACIQGRGCVDAKHSAQVQNSAPYSI